MYREPSFARCRRHAPRLPAPGRRVRRAAPSCASRPTSPRSSSRAPAAFAQVVPHEQPVALLDSTVMQSGKGGALVTTIALHLDAPRLRIPLEHLSWEPAFPAGFDASGVLHTPQGPVHLVRLPSRELSAALARLLSALAWWVRRGGGFALGAGAAAGPVGALAAQWLRGEGLAPSPVIAAQSLHVAGACLPDWIAPDSDEELLALVDETVSRDGTRAIALHRPSDASPTAARAAADPVRADPVRGGLQGPCLPRARLVVAGQRVEVPTVLARGRAGHRGPSCYNVTAAPAGAPPRRARSASWRGRSHRRPRLAARPRLARPSGLHPLRAGARRAREGRRPAGRRARPGGAHRLLQQALRQGHARHGGASVSPLSVVDMEFLLWQCLGQPDAAALGPRGEGAGVRPAHRRRQRPDDRLQRGGPRHAGGGGHRLGGRRRKPVAAPCSCASPRRRAGRTSPSPTPSGAALSAPEPKLYSALSGAFADASAEALLAPRALRLERPLQRAPRPARRGDRPARGPLLGRADAGPFVRRDGLAAPPR
jgi:hypothetical protein